MNSSTFPAVHHRAQEQAPGVTRRSVARGLAWTAPAIAASAAAPMAAASPIEGPTFQYIDACKSPGNSCKSFPKGYEFTYTVCNPGSEPLYLYTVTYEVTGANLTLVHALPTLPTLLDPGMCAQLVFRADGSTSAALDFTAVMTVTWGHTLNPMADVHDHMPVLVPFAVGDTPPDCPCIGG